MLSYSTRQLMLSFTLVLIGFFASCAKEQTHKTPPEPVKTLSVLPPPELLKSNAAPVTAPSTEIKMGALKTTPIDDGFAASPKEHAANLAKVKSILGDNKTDASVEILRAKSPEQKPIPTIKNDQQLALTVQNTTGQQLILACFYYSKVRMTGYWRWYKSPVYRMKENETITIPIAAAADKETKENIYAYFGIFSSEQEAADATYESLKDNQKIDLDRVAELQNTTIALTITRYGFTEEKVDYAIVNPTEKAARQPELDFLVENDTDKPLLITCFVYQKDSDKEAFDTWQYHKTPVQRVEPGESIAVDIATIRELYDWIYMRGFLGVFDTTQASEAADVTYELLTPAHKINIGRLADLLGKRIVISVQKYGTAGTILDFQPKPIRRIDFEKRHKSHRSRALL